MKVAVLGGTGKMGGNIAKQLAKSHEIIIGSRDPARAAEAAKAIKGAKGADYAGACREADVIVFTLPYSAISMAAGLADEAAGKLVVSVVNPIKLQGSLLVDSMEQGSGAEELARLLPKSRVATAFNNVPVAMFGGDVVVPMDIVVAASSKEAYEEAAALVRSIPNLRPLYAGDLSQARVVEMMTPLLLNMAKLNGTGSLTTRFPSKKG